MRMVAAVLCMGLIGSLAVALAVITALMRMLPLIVIVAVALLVLRRRRADAGGSAAPAAVPRARPAVMASGGWLLVPARVAWRETAHPPITVDGEILSETHRG
jgi:hypothetical protein